MTIRQAITKIHNLKPGRFDDETLIGWLSDIEGMIYSDIFGIHGEGGEFCPFDPEKDLSKELAVKPPFDDLYLKYLAAQMDYHNAETARYANSMVMFNAAFSAFADAYNRSHLPKKSRAIKLFGGGL